MAFAFTSCNLQISILIKGNQNVKFLREEK